MTHVPRTQTAAIVIEVSCEALEAARRGAPDGISALYHAYADNMLRTATRITSSRSDAEDIVHDVFVGLPEFLRRYVHQGQLASWLRSLVVRLALDRMRRDLRRESSLLRAAQGWIAEFATPPPSSTDSDHRLDLAQLIGTLPAGLRVVFVLRFFEEQSYEQIAMYLHITAGSARVRYLRALRRLRRIIEAEP